MQDNVMAHTAKNSVDTLYEVFGRRVKSRVMWPPRLPDLNTCDFYLWGTLKVKVYVKNPHSLEELQENIRHDISIPVRQLRRLSRNMFSQCEPCLETEDPHFETSVKYCNVHYCRKSGRKLSATAAGLWEKSTASAPATSLKILKMIS